MNNILTRDKRGKNRIIFPPTNFFPHWRMYMLFQMLREKTQGKGEKGVHILLGGEENQMWLFAVNY